MLSEMLSDRSLWTLGLIYSVLILATAMGRYLVYRHKDRDYSELTLRIRSWWVMIIIFTLAISIYRSWAIIFLGVVSFIALKEFLSLIPTRRADRRVLLICYLLIPIQYWLIHADWYGLYIILVPVYGFIAISVSTVLTGQTEGFLRSISTLHWGSMITVFALSHLAFLLALPENNATHVTGATLLLFIFLITQINDVAQYTWGKTFGRRKIIPSVSPNKTWEGLVGGVLTTCIFSLFLGPYLTPFTYMESLIMGVILGVGGFFGDITVSAIKRDLDVKDTSTLLPGHGGILDRLDSISISVPIFFHILYYMKY